jgi:uncharacterized protein
MRPVRAVGLYLLFIFLGGALLAPWVYKLVQASAHGLPWLHSLASKPFARYVGRCFMLLAIVGLRPLLRQVELASWREIGLPSRTDGPNRLATGFLVGFVSLAIIVAVALAAGVRVRSPDLSAVGIVGRGFKAAFTAALIAPLEELFFRGALFGALRKTFHWTLALGLSSLAYAFLHFLDRAPEPAVVVWSSGLSALVSMSCGLAAPERLLPGLLNLTFVGVILGLAYQKSGSLHFSIGLHAGWIFWLKTYGAVTDDVSTTALRFYGTNKLIDGWLGFIILAVVFSLLIRFMVSSDPQSGWKERRLFS